MFVLIVVENVIVLIYWKNWGFKCGYRIYCLYGEKLLLLIWSDGINCFYIGIVLEWELVDFFGDE